MSRKRGALWRTWQVPSFPPLWEDESYEDWLQRVNRRLTLCLDRLISTQDAAKRHYWTKCFVGMYKVRSLADGRYHAELDVLTNERKRREREEQARYKREREKEIKRLAEKAAEEKHLRFVKSLYEPENSRYIFSIWKQGKSVYELSKMWKVAPVIIRDCVMNESKKAINNNPILLDEMRDLKKQGFTFEQIATQKDIYVDVVAMLLI